VHIRALSPSDAPAYRALLLRGYELAPDAFTTAANERVGEPIEWWHKRISDPSGLSQAFGAFHDAALIGGVAIEYSAKVKLRHKGHIIGMYVSEDHRRSGAGRALLQAVVDDAESRAELKVLTLTVTEGNSGALRLYESVGFEVFGVEKMAIFTGAEYKAKVHMQLLLRQQTDAEA
jgi:ribosomal protein S18 acetylase RimI-like enzyme